MWSCRFSVTDMRSRGFTILEVMVAFVILATAAVALLGLRSQAVRNFGIIQERQAALILAEDRMQRILLKAHGHDPVDMSSPELLERYEDYEVEDEEGEPDESELPPGLVYPVGWIVYKYRVTVKWTGGDGQGREYTLTRVAAVPELEASEP